MLGKWKSKVFLVLMLAVLVASLPACSPATAPAPAVPTQKVEPTTAAPTETTAPTATEVPPTATTEPTATPVPPTSTPTETATPIPPDQQITSWCILKEKVMGIKASEDPATMPEGATPSKLQNGVLTVYKPAVSCVFVLNLGQPAPDGTQLEVVDAYGHVFLKANFNPSQKDPNLSYAALTHPSIVDPQVWMTNYGLQVKSGDAVLWKGKLHVQNSWLPALCWDSVYPDYKRGLCHRQQDLHPWDAGYTPVPHTP